MNIHGWSFIRAMSEVCQTASINTYTKAPPCEPPPLEPKISQPTPRVREMLRTSSRVECVPAVVEYLESRYLWPLPDGCRIRASVAAEYWDSGRKVGVYPAMLAPVHDIRGELVTCHVTYLQDSRKLTDREPRKIMSGMSGRIGCAVRLTKEAGEMGIGEGIETCLAWHLKTGLAAWAALNTSLLQRFETSHRVEKIHVIADKDTPGLVAAWKLRDRLEMPMELNVPINKDFAEDWEKKHASD